MKLSIDQDLSSAYWMFDILWVIKAQAADTNNAFSMIEQTMPYGSGPPPHYHQDMDEMFYILEGELTLWLDGKILKLEKGAFARIPKGTPHYFKISSKQPCKALNMYTPGGFEEGIVRNATRATALTLPPENLVYEGSMDKDDMHVSVDIQPINLLG
jgi:mannose-6-phosphate isomerase-like protein (cupin superfamily)